MDEGLKRSGLEIETEQGVQTPDRGQGRAVYQIVACRVGLRDAVQKFRGAQAVATPLPVDLYKVVGATWPWQASPPFQQLQRLRATE